VAAACADRAPADGFFERTQSATDLGTRSFGERVRAGLGDVKVGERGATHRGAVHVCVWALIGHTETIDRLIGAAANLVHAGRVIKPDVIIAWAAVLFFRAALGLTKAAHNVMAFWHVRQLGEDGDVLAWLAVSVML
jgi:hypothetical protein